jgi:hypothetical protein
VTLQPPTAQDVARHPEYTAFQPSMSGWYLNKKSTALRDDLTKQIRGYYADGTAAAAVKEWGGDPSAMLTPIPEFAAQRAKVDRAADWTPASVG